MKRFMLVVAACLAGCASQQATSADRTAGGAAAAPGSGGGDPNSPSVIGASTPTPTVRLPPQLAAQLGVSQPTPATPSYLEQIANHCPTQQCQAVVQVCSDRQCILTPQ